MAIFGKKSEQTPSAPSARAAALAPRPRSKPLEPMPAAAGKSSFLGPGCVFEGEFNGDGSFECSGDFEGTIDIAGDLVIGHGGNARAELKARRITIEGHLRGDATGTEKVEVGATGHVEGDVRAPAVQFAEGASFEGNVEMRRGKAAAAAADEANDSPGSDPAQQGGGTPGSSSASC